MTEFDIVDAAAIRDGRATDAYFERTEAALEHAGRNPASSPRSPLTNSPTATSSCSPG